jgi:hypothetical protein
MPLLAVAMHREDLVSSLNSSLLNWGFEFIQESETEHHSSFRGQVIKHPVTEDGDFSTVLVNLLFILVCIALLFVCLLGSEDETEEIRGDRRVRMMSPKTRELEGIQEAPSYEGSWAQAYRTASGENREALELLFRCHIISTYEFAESRVSQEHIDECIWIGRHMLSQKPMSEWVVIRHQAKEAFEESAVACFQERSESRPSSSAWDSHAPTPLASAPNSARQLLGHRSDGVSPELLYATAGHPLSTSSSLSNESQQHLVLPLPVSAQVREFPTAQFEKMELHKAASQSTTATQPSHATTSSSEDFNIPLSFRTYAESHSAKGQETAMSEGMWQPPQIGHSRVGEVQPQPYKAKKRPEVPRMNLQGMSQVRSSREEDDDPYTTRDIY